MSTEDELRKAVRLALAQWAVVPLSHLGYIADAVLALPEVAALIADAERVQRVRELLAAMDPIEVALGGLMYVHGEVTRALDGDQ